MCLTASIWCDRELNRKFLYKITPLNEPPLSKYLFLLNHIDVYKLRIIGGNNKFLKSNNI